MLVLNRKIGERIVIGDEVVVTVVAVSGRQVRIGIEAPASVSIWREELLAENQPVSVQMAQTTSACVEVQC